MLLEIPPKYSVSSIMGYLKGKSSQKWGDMKYKYRNREFRCRGYYVDTVGKKDIRVYKESAERRCGKQSINNGNRPIYG